LLINLVILFSLILGYMNSKANRYSFTAIGCVRLIVLNGMFFLFRGTEPDLPPEKIRGLTDRIVLPIILLAGLVFLNERSGAGARNQRFKVPLKQNWNLG
jgi:hypothetical protein